MHVRGQSEEEISANSMNSKWNRQRCNGQLGCCDRLTDCSAHTPTHTHTHSRCPACYSLSVCVCVSRVMKAASCAAHGLRSSAVLPGGGGGACLQPKYLHCRHKNCINVIIFSLDFMLVA